MAEAEQVASRPLPRWSRLPLAVICGVVMGLGMAPYDLWYLSFFGLIGACWLFLAAPKGIYAVGTGWAVGLGYFGFSLGWIVEPFMVDAAQTGWMAPFALLGMAGGLALFWALAFGAAGQVRSGGLFVLVLAMAGAELARAYIFTGFPWAMLAYIWAPVAPIQWVAVIGPHGLTLLTMSVAALFARFLVQRGAWREAGIAAVGVSALFLGGALLIPPVQDLSGRPVVRLIQPNAPQHEKWDPELIPVFFERQIALTAAEADRAPDLVIWPETALPMLLHRADRALSILSGAAGSAQAVVGVQRSDAGRYFNSLAVIGAQGAVRQVYDKHHLVPFGEYMPAAGLFARWNIAGLAERAEGAYTPGPGPQLLDLGPLGRALPLICYEAVFPQDVFGAPERPDMLLQITNDAWFGKWSGPYQHLAQARIRAIEQGLPMLRSANTGVSAVIDGGGRILAQLPLGEAGFVDLEIPPPARVTLYSRTGDLPVLMLLIALSTAAFLRRRRVSV